MVKDRAVWFFPILGILCVCLLGYFVLSGGNKDKEEPGNITIEQESLPNKDSIGADEHVNGVPISEGDNAKPEAPHENSFEATDGVAKDSSANRDKKSRLDEALESMRSSLGTVDPRTPEMSEPYQRELPTEEELNDPALYEAYELRQSKKMASVYSAVTREIPLIRKRIDAARLDGSRSDDEIREAEEALRKMEELSELIELQEPGLADELDNSLIGVDEAADKVSSGQLKDN